MVSCSSFGLPVHAQLLRLFVTHTAACAALTLLGAASLLGGAPRGRGVPEISAVLVGAVPWVCMSLVCGYGRC